MRKHGFTITELVVVLAVAGTAVALAGPAMMAPEARRTVSLRNMQAIGVAGGSYRLDNDDYLPIEGIYGPRRTEPTGSMVSWCTWTAGGKNNSRWWTEAAVRRINDIEAADRPLNPYAMPGVVFAAPPPPATLPGSDPARVNEQAPVFKDPSAMNSHQRYWPNPNPTAMRMPAYDDVGSGFFWNAKWWDQLLPTATPDQRMLEATRKMATGEGAPPHRFVWFNDQVADIVANSANPQFKLTNGYGDINKSVLLMIDGRAGYYEVFPGKQYQSYHTEHFSLGFQ